MSTDWGRLLTDDWMTVRAQRTSRLLIAAGLMGSLMIGCGDDPGGGLPADEIDWNDACVESVDVVEEKENVSPISAGILVRESGERFDVEGYRYKEDDGSYTYDFDLADGPVKVPSCSIAVDNDPSDDETGESSDTGEAPDESTTTEVATTTEAISPTTSVSRTTTTQSVGSTGGTTTSRAPNTTMATMPSYNSTTTSYVPTGPPDGTWIRNDSHCSWLGTSSSCGVYSGGNGQWEEVGPAGGPSSTFFPIAGTPGQIAYNLFSGNSIINCGSGGCGWYFTSTPGTYEMGPVAP